MVNVGANVAYMDPMGKKIATDLLMFFCQGQFPDGYGWPLPDATQHEFTLPTPCKNMCRLDTYIWGMYNKMTVYI